MPNAYAHRNMRLAIGAAGGLALAAFLANAFANVRDRRRFPAPGTLIDVGGHRLHLHCLGEGDPAVVFECGAGDESSSWFEVQREVAKTTKACVYDRAGIGWSEGARAKTRSVEDYVHELRTLLERGGVSTPIVIVAQSLGGVFALHLATQYPDEVAGLVLVDAGYKQTYESLATRNPQMATRIKRMMRLAPVAAAVLRLGAGRIIGPRMFPHESDVRGPRISHLQPKMVRAMVAEGRLLTDLSAVKSAPRRDIPVVVLAQDQEREGFTRPTGPDEIDVRWNDLQRELAAMFDDSDLRTVERAGHMIHLDRPDAVVEAVNDVLDAVRTGATLRRSG